MSERSDVGGVSASEASRAEVCAIACAEAFRDNGEILVSAFGTIPTIGARLARHTFSPDLLLSDGEASLVRGTWAIGAPVPEEVEAWIPFRTIFDIVWNGKRHVMMIPSQIDAYGNMNLSAIGDHAKPKVQLLGARGAPGNSVCHPTSYWVPKHSSRVFTSTVDMICGVGNDKAAAAGPAASKFHDLRQVVTNLGVLDYDATSGKMRLATVHPGVSVDEVVEATGFELVIPDEVPSSRVPTAEELTLIREVLDPRSFRDREVKA